MSKNADRSGLLRDLLIAADRLNTLIDETDRMGTQGPGADTFTRALKAMIEGWCADYAEQLAPQLVARIEQQTSVNELARLSQLRLALDIQPTEVG
ncbi:MAG: hypothetical protein AAF556_04395 [Pseudomonadota bacterium]